MKMSIRARVSAANMAALLAQIAWLSIFSFPSHAGTPEDIDKKLKEFEANPREFILNHKNVAKYDPDTLKPVKDTSHFSKNSILSKEFVLQKNESRPEEVFSRVARVEGRARFLPNDLAENLVDRLNFRTLEQMEEAQLQSSTLKESPWSDDYWPIYTGVIAKRYADPGFPASKVWDKNRDYIFSNSSSADQLSPAEKYDLLVGDHQWTMTNVMVNLGAKYGGGEVERWMGICHGWAPASYMLPRPTHSIDLISVDGYKIRFYPSDIKALATALWANLSPPTRFIGGRCKAKEPAEDSNGRILSPECFDTNPGTWHLSVVNQIGVSKRSFILDATYDYEVWNQPVLSYEYSYFNPQLFKKVNTLQEAIVPINKFTQDKFSKYRSSSAAYIVGVAMKLVYIKEVSPSHTSPDLADYDKRIAVDYLYDLELDKHHQIIGGEWYNREHPDFLWTPSQRTRAWTVHDKELSRHPGSWNGSDRLPSHWRSAAISASQEGLPLASIVEALIVLSRL